MKKPDQVEAAEPTTGGELKAAVTGLLARAAEREAQLIAQLQAEAEPACELGRAALPIYAEMAREHGPWLREVQRELRPDRLNTSQWVVQIVEARRQVAEALKILDSPLVIEKYLREVAAITPQYVGTGRVFQISRQLTEATFGAARVVDLMRTVKGLVEELIPRLQAEGALAPLVSEPVVPESRANRSRFAKSTLRHGDDAA